MICPSCKKKVRELFQRISDGKWVGLCCVDRETLKVYPEMKKLKSKNSSN